MLYFLVLYFSSKSVCFLAVLKRFLSLIRSCVNNIIQFVSCLMEMLLVITYNIVILYLLLFIIPMRICNYYGKAYSDIKTFSNLYCRKYFQCYHNTSSCMYSTSTPGRELTPSFLKMNSSAVNLPGVCLETSV